jgi:hypothetical protein
VNAAGCRHSISALIRLKALPDGFQTEFISGQNVVRQDAAKKAWSAGFGWLLQPGARRG